MAATLLFPARPESAAALAHADAPSRIHQFRVARATSIGMTILLRIRRAARSYNRLMQQATYEDANLILKLYELRREDELRKARSWFAGNFSAASAEEAMQKYPRASQESVFIRMVTSYWEMACSFVTSGVLNQELLFQSGGELLVVWEKIRPIAGDMRKMTGNPNAYANLEKVANAYIKYMGPQAYAGFQAMVGSASVTAGQA